MTSVGTVLSYPIPAYQNVPIEAQFYQPSRFQISNITFGKYTIVTTSEDHNYVIAQQIRLIIPPIFGTYQLNNAVGYVISIPTTTSIILNIDSLGFDTFIPNPYTATITNIVVDSATQITVTANNYFVGGTILFSDVSGMSEINSQIGTILSVNSTSFTVSISTTGFSAYMNGGVATLFNVPQNQAETLAIGDINTGVTNTQGRINQITYIPGSFIDISPA